MPLAALGLFTFELATAPWDTLARSTDWRWPSKDRVRAGPAHQFTGPGADTLTIDGALMPELTGGPDDTLDKLRAMASDGKAWILTDGQGRAHGRWFIGQITEKGSHHLANGAPRRIEFTIALHRYWDDDPDAKGELARSL